MLVKYEIKKYVIPHLVLYLTDAGFHISYDGLVMGRNGTEHENSIKAILIVIFRLLE